MKVDAKVKRALDDLPLPYEVHKAKDHYFASVRGYPRIVIAGNHDKSRARSVTETVASIKRLRRQIVEDTTSGHSDD